MNALTVLATGGDEFKAPGPELFDFPPLFAGGARNRAWALTIAPRRMHAMRDLEHAENRPT